MALTEINQGQKIDLQENQLIFVMKGTIRADFAGGHMTIKNQDVLGCLDIGESLLPIEYTAIEKCSVVIYQYDSNNYLEFIKKHSDIRKFLIKSSFRQFNEIASALYLVNNEYRSLKSYIASVYDDYIYYCEKSEISPNEIADLEEVINADFDNAIPEWMTGFYTGLEDIISSVDIKQIQPEFILGMLTKIHQDSLMALSMGSELVDSKADVEQLLFSPSANDLLEMYSNLYIKLIKKVGQDDDVSISTRRALNDMELQIKSLEVSSYDYYEERMATHRATLDNIDDIIKGKLDDARAVGEECYDLVSNSLNTILSYADVGAELSESFYEHIDKYKNTISKNGNSEELKILKKQINSEFYQIYLAAFLKSVTEVNIPPVVKMFFEFGYVDEELAGIENAVYLYKIVRSIPTDPDRGVYTIYEWLTSIYNNEKNPSRSELDVDYEDTLREMERNKQITKNEGKELFLDPERRVTYEIENAFPSVNKTTSGRVMTFCPVLSEHNILKDLSSCLVMADKVEECFDKICSVDYSAYYRQNLYVNEKAGINREYIDVEVRPDIILTPNVGNRGIMWQEIEGKRRTTPARMFLSIFQQEDLYTQLLRLTGQFRWEMCKRIQGARWNDVTDRSLTSEYFDYIQYYKKNKDLSPEAKAKIKNDLTKAKNSFREMFIHDYIYHVQYESKGSPRHNKIVRGIMFRYIPFSRDIRMELNKNPMFKEITDRYEIQVKSQIHRLENLIKKINNSGNVVPEEIEKELEYLNK